MSESAPLPLVPTRTSPATPTLLLYTTLGCHLCEQAKQLMWPVLAHYGYRLEAIDIAGSEAMVERYGVRIPVVARSDSGIELDWPFDAQMLAELLSR